MNQIIDFNKLVSIKRIFETTPSPQGNYLYLTAFFGAAIIAGIIFKIVLAKNTSKYVRAYRKFFGLLLFIGISGLVMVFFRWQSIPYIGSRFALLVVALISLVWLLQILIYRFVSLPKQFRLKLEKEKLKKYLPREKSKGLSRPKSRK